MFVVKTVLIAGILATLSSGALMAIWVITDFFAPPALYVVMLVASLGVSSILYLMHKH